MTRRLRSLVQWRPTELDSQNGLSGRPRRILRPRMFVYGALGLAGLLAGTVALRQRHDFEANILRITGAPYVLDGEGVA